ncbi:GDSL-type esterase/lipase family protein [Streptomyces sp. NPDC051940]|uniref:GDSL-type esterase/lipase family protein n=1 Tax=Streptomyces sp. NPDC051940 TaxID=3155675 RepID=UPI00341A6C6E
MARKGTGMRMWRKGLGVRSVTAVAGVTALLALAGCSAGDPNAEARAATSPPARAKASPRPKGPQWDTSPGSLAALGDSITRGFDACDALADCPEVSWATGTSGDVDSVAARLGTPANRVWNFARTGAQMDDLPAQTDEAIARKPELVTILMGANDACVTTPTAMTSVGTYRQTFASVLAELRQRLPKTQVYVSSVPNLERLWKVGHNNEMTRRIWSLGICQSMLKSPVSFDPQTVNRRTAVLDRVRAYNEALRTECAKHPLCRYDEGATFTFAFTPSHLSKWDYFHPNKSGQGELAELAYDRITGGA